MVRKKILFLVLILLVFVFLLLGGCYAFFIKKGITIPFLEKKPDKVMELMYEKMNNLNSYHINRNLKISGKIPSTKDISMPAGDANLDFKMEGNVDNSNKEELKTAILTSVNLEASIFKINAELEMKNIGKKMYYKVNKIPDLPIAANMLDIKSYLNQWYEIDSEEIDKLGSDLGIKRAGELNAEEKNKEIEKIKEQFKGLGKKYKIFVPQERLRDEKINGENSYHYKVIADKNSLKEMLKEIFNILRETEEFKKNKFVKGDMEKEINEGIDKFINALTTLEGEVWIGKKTFYLHKYTFNINLEWPDKPDLVIKFNIDAELSNINENLEIKKPDDAKSFYEVFKNSVEAKRKKSIDPQRVSDIKQLQIALELYYNDYNKYPSSLEDLTKTGEKNISRYMSVLPKDPVTNEIYEYVYHHPIGIKERETYELKFFLDNDTGEIKAGLNIAHPSGIISMAEKFNPDSVKSCQEDKDCIGSCNQEDCFNHELINDCGFNIPLCVCQNNVCQKKEGENEENKDTDQDGLTDLDENLIWKTNPNKADTDGDGYKDGEEVKNGYNPNGAGKLK